MRQIRWFLMCSGLLFVLGANVNAQDESKIEQEAYRKAIEAVQRQQAAATEQMEEARKQLELNLKLLELRQREIGGKEKKEVEKSKIRVEKKNVELPAEGLESKIEQLLKEMRELRKDVNEIKSKLKFPTPANNYWQQYGPYLPSKNTETKKEEKIEIEINRKKQAELLEAAQERLKVERQRAEETRKVLERLEQSRKAVERAELQERLDQLLRHADELRRAIEKSKAK